MRFLPKLKCASLALILLGPAWGQKATYLIPRKVLLLPYQNQSNKITLNYLQHSIPGSINIELLNTFKYTTFLLRDVQTLVTRKSLYNMSTTELAIMARELECSLLIIGNIDFKNNEVLLTTSIIDVRKPRVVTEIKSRSRSGLELFSALNLHSKKTLNTVVAKYPPLLKEKDLQVTRTPLIKDLMLMVNGNVATMQSQLEANPGALAGPQVFLRSALLSPVLHPTFSMGLHYGTRTKLELFDLAAGLSLPVYLNNRNYMALHALAGYAGAKLNSERKNSLSLNFGFFIGIHLGNNLITNFGFQAMIFPQFYSALNIAATAGVGYVFF